MRIGVTQPKAKSRTKREVNKRKTSRREWEASTEAMPSSRLKKLVIDTIF